jgi:hypothetical protein
MNEYMEEKGPDVPSTSPGAGWGAAGIGAGAGVLAANQIPKMLEEITGAGAGASSTEQAIAKALGGAGAAGPWKRYLGLPALGGAALGLPVLAGAHAAKEEGGAGRGAATGTLLPLLYALLYGSKGGGASAVLKRMGIGAGVGAAGGAVLGTIGGGIQKHRRNKYEAAKEQEEEPSKAASMGFYAGVKQAEGDPMSRGDARRFAKSLPSMSYSLMKGQNPEDEKTLRKALRKEEILASMTPADVDRVARYYHRVAGPAYWSSVGGGLGLGVGIGVAQNEKRQIFKQILQDEIRRRQKQ